MRTARSGVNEFAGKRMESDDKKDRGSQRSKVVGFGTRTQLDEP